MTHHHEDNPQQPGHQHGHGHYHAPASDQLSGMASVELAECPVMPASTVVKAEAEAAGLVRDHNGQRYWLCCHTCGPLFDADPDRYTQST